MTSRSFREYFFLAASASPVILTLALATIVANTLVFKSWHPAVNGAGLLGEASLPALKHLPAPPLSFETNFGQFDHDIRFFVRADGYDVSLMDAEAGIRLRTSVEANSHPLRMKFKGANPSPEIKGREQQPGGINYLIGGDARANTVKVNVK